MHINLPSDEGESLTFSEIFPKELEQIQSAREKRLGLKESRGGKPDELVGLAFSGGGIRSATFNLGVIQALAKGQLLSKIDYLSTVSGGGYIGSWLSSWAYWLRKKYPDRPNQIAQIEQELSYRAPNIGDASEPDEVHFLRRYSNYLTPRLGVLSGDTLAFAATYLRNLLLNQAIVIFALAALLLLPHSTGLALTRDNPIRLIIFSGVVGFVSLALALTGVAYAAAQMRARAASEEGGKTTPIAGKAVFWLVALPLFVFCFSLAYVTWGVVADSSAGKSIVEYLPGLLINMAGWFPRPVATVLMVAVLYTALWVVSTIAAEIGAPTRSTAGQAVRRWAPAISAIPAGIVGGLLLLWMCDLFSHWPSESPQSAWYLVAFGVPLTTIIVLFVGAVHLGMIGRAYEDLSREWWARLGGIVLALAVCWCLLSCLTLFVPLWMRLFWESLHRPAHGWVSKLKQTLSSLGIMAAVGGWITASIKGLFAAKGDAATGGPRAAEDGTAGLDVLARLAPPVFVIGLMALLSWLLYFFVPAIAGISRQQGYWELLSAPGWLIVTGIGFGLLLVSVILGWRVDVNEFSLHNAYRNRLVRCYLGATHRSRHYDPFTGFEESDNIRMHELCGLGAPFHIVNATLNVTKGEELALQARKARSFIFTPLYSGFDYSDKPKNGIPAGSGASQSGATHGGTSGPCADGNGSYRLSENCSHKSPHAGARLGTAMAISGAAVSPNMGHYSNGAVSFLLTIFSVRLGWWLGNPCRKKSWESGAPRSSWIALFRELTGSCNEDQSEVYLSDGGHFDNLGVYELVRRRCRLIIACDAGQDPDRTCGDLTSLIEKCRVDFGARISFESLGDLRSESLRLPTGQTILASKQPFAIGTIEYPDNRQGALIYIKPSLFAELPQDVLAYAALTRNVFPHQSTGDQFFDELQFESYRSLGEACAGKAVRSIFDRLPQQARGIAAG